MNRARNLLADILVGIVILIVLWWVLRRVIGLVFWLVNNVAFIAVIVLLLVIANRVRSR